MELSKETMRATSYIPTFQAKIQGLERTVRVHESDLKHHTGEAEKYKNQVYGLQVDLEGVEARLSEEIQTLKDRLRLTEGERDALKTSLKEEEIMRIAAEGQLALPATTTDEQDEFGSPIRSPRKQRTPERDDEDKENVSPKKGAVELRFLQQELASEKRLRERAQEQVEFMKMECQFGCCSCRIAELQNTTFIHDNSYAAEMERIKASIPLTPSPSIHEDDIMEDVAIREEFAHGRHPPSPPPDEPHQRELQSEQIEEALEVPELSRDPLSVTPEPAVLFSPTTGTFRAVSSPADAASTHAPSLSCITEITREASPPTPDAESTVICTDPIPTPSFRMQDRAESEPKATPEAKSRGIYIHEDAIDDSDDEDVEAQTPLHGPSGPATPAQYILRTVTTTTTIPLHFSPMTPATKKVDQAMTPSTIAHMPANAKTPVLGELSLNMLPFDREAALAAIRQRRGRARSMAAGHGTPMKQQVITERRDISAPVSRIRR